MMTLILLVLLNDRRVRVREEKEHYKIEQWTKSLVLLVRNETQNLTSIVFIIGTLEDVRGEEFWGFVNLVA